MDKELTPKQKIFVQEYCYDWNRSRAYKVAYPNVKDETAIVNATRLLSYANVQAYVTEAQKDLEKQAGISRLRVVRELMSMAFTDIADIVEKYEKDGIQALTRDERKSIAQIKKTVSEGENYNNTSYYIKAHDKRAAIELLNKMLGYNEPDKIDHTTNGKPIIVNSEQTKNEIEKLK